MEITENEEQRKEVKGSGWQVCRYGHKGESERIKGARDEITV